MGEGFQAIRFARTSYADGHRRLAKRAVSPSSEMPLKTEPVTINLGPQHPSTHGVFRLRVTFDGEVVLRRRARDRLSAQGARRSWPKERNFVQIVTLTDRLDYVAAIDQQPRLRACRRAAGRD